MSPNKDRPARRGLPEDPYATHLSYHRRRCKVCKHPGCNAIEEEFLRWRCPQRIAAKYGIRNRASLYRHAHATGLYSLRRSRYRAALEDLIERNAEVQLNADSIICAVRACTRINDDGKWVAHHQHIIVTHINASSNASSSPAPVQMAEKSYLTNYSGRKTRVAASRPNSQHDHKLNWPQLDENKEPDLFQIATKIEMLERLLN
jgi:hypothetical protein